MFCRRLFKNYFITVNGQIYSFFNNKLYKRRLVVNKCGYVFISIHKKNYLLHRLLAEMFIPNPENKLCVNHKDGDKKNNKLENLEWVTHSENTQHAIKNKLFNPKIKSKIGSNNGMAKLNEKQVKEIKQKLQQGFGPSELGRLYNVSHAIISGIKHNKIWSHVCVF